MECNIKKPIFFIFLVLAAGLLPAQEGVFTGNVDFTRSLRDFQPENSPKSDNRIYILDGTVGDVFIQDPAAESFTAIVELIQGEWRELAEIRSFNGYLIFKGPTFSTKIPEKKPRRPAADMVYSHRRILTAVRFDGLQEIAEGVQVPVFQALYYKLLD